MLLLVLLLSCAFLGADGIRLGSFNCQVFGLQKLKDPQVADVIAKIISRYDILFFQEIRDASGQAFPLIVEQARKLSGLKVKKSKEKMRINTLIPRS
jgi:hypothetical protein